MHAHALANRYIIEHFRIIFIEDKTIIILQSNKIMEMSELKVYPKHPIVLSSGALSKDKVINSQGDDLGSVEDFIIDTTAGRVIYAILSFGGFLGVGDKLFAIPWDTMDLNTDKHAFVLDVDKDRLKNAPSFNKTNWSDINSQDWARNVYNYYGQAPYWTTPSAVSGGSPEYGGYTGVSARSISIASANTPPSMGGPEVYSSAPSPQSASAMNLIKASDLKGDMVKNKANEDLGKIEEIMIQLDSGRIGYTVLSFGGFLGMGNKLFAVPWHAMSFDPGKREYILDMPKGELKNAPGFDKNNWPDTENPDWDKEVQGFYGKTRPEK